MRVIAIASLGLGIAVTVFGFVGCSSSSPATTPANDGGTSSRDASVDSSIPPTDGSDTDAAEDSGALEAAPADAFAGPFTAVTSIPLPGNPSAMVFNPVTNSLYVALTQPGAAGTGSTIVVIDSATNLVATTIAYPGDAATPYPIVQLAVDDISNTLYAADSNDADAGGQMLYVIDGVANAVVTTIPIGSDLGMQVDSVAHKIYVLGAGAPALPEGGAASVSPPTITVIDGTTNTAGAPIAIGDQAVFAGSAIALDPIVRRLYLCGPNATEYSNKTTNLAAIEALDTADALAPLGAQQSFSGEQAVACLAGWGGGAVVTTGAAAINFAGGSSIALPAGLAASAAVGAADVFPEKADVVVFGSTASPNALEVTGVTERQDGGASITLPATAVLGGLGASGWQAVLATGASGGVVQAYVSLVGASPVDGGAGSVIYATIQVH